MYVDICGYRIDATGLHPLKDNVEAIQDAPIPKSITELKSYIVLLSYYGKFLPSLSIYIISALPVVVKGPTVGMGRTL